MSSIPCLAWAKRGATVGRPQKVKLTEEELADLVNAEIDELSDNEDDVKMSGSSSASSDNDCDDSDDIDNKYGLGDYEKDSKTSKHGLSLKNLIWQRQDVQDHYLIEDDEESEDGEIQPDDNILAVGRVKNDVFGLEAYVYNEASSSLFCHHDTILSSFPLAMEWVGYDPGEDAPGNLLAVGTVKPQIELWDLDVINTLEPAFILGETHKKRDEEKSGTSRDRHMDAVLALSWNDLQQNALASGSADFTVGLWDLEEGKMVTCIDQHEEKVQALQWHPFEKELLLSGSFDKTARVFDCRYSEASGRSWRLSGEVEKVVWNARQPFHFMASTDDGVVNCFDVRTESPVFTVKAHKDAVTGLAISSELPGCMVTTSNDQLVKVWDLRNNEPDMVCQVNLGVGQIHSMAPCPDSGFIYAVGAESDLRIFHLKTSDKVLTRWNLDAVPGRANKKPKAVDSDLDTSDSDPESTEDESSEASHKSDSDTDNEPKLDTNDKHNQPKQLDGKHEKSRHGKTRTSNKQEKKLKNSRNENNEIVEKCISKKKKNKAQDLDDGSRGMRNPGKNKKPSSKSDEKPVGDKSKMDDGRVKKKKKTSSEECVSQVEMISQKKSCKHVVAEKKEKKKKSLKRVYQQRSSDVNHPENASLQSSDPDVFEPSSGERCHEVKLKKGKKKSKKKGHLDS